MKKSTWQHLRIPFSFFLLPVFLFALGACPVIELQKALLVFFILHLLLYPASNGYNSYFDKDEGSIGGLKNPPKVSKELYYTSLLFDFFAIALGLLLSWQFAFMLFVYGLVSKAYSHPWVRLKKMPIIGWLAAGFFQGSFTFLMVLVGINNLNLNELVKPIYFIPSLLSSLLLWGSYPMTQVYQHEEDAARGDQTLSLKLGIRGTFHFTALMFSVANVGFLSYYLHFFSSTHAIAFQVVLLPMLLFFGWWYLKVRKDEKAADYENTMRLNLLSSLVLNLFFLFVLLY